MKFTKKGKNIIIILLILFNIIIRIPSVYHETGIDSFDTHLLANSISEFGVAKWWAHPFSIFGFYPYSYASAVMFIASGISQITGIDMEITLWVYCMIIGLLGAGIAYLMAGVILDDDAFKILVAFIFSVSPGMLTLSSWDASTRGLFIVLTPLLLYLLIKFRSNRLRFGLLFIGFMLLLTAIHHFVFLTIPIILGYFAIILFKKFKNFAKISEIPENFYNIAYIAACILVFLLGFTGKIFMDSGWGRLEYIGELMNNNVRYTGLLILVAIPGFLYLSFKSKKTFGEWFFLVAFLFFIPFLNIMLYAHYFFLVFSSVLISLSLINIVKSHNKIKKYSIPIFILLLISSVFLSGFLQHWRFGSQRYGDEGGSGGVRYLPQATYISGLWMKDKINGNMVANSQLTAKRILAVSEVPTFTGYGEGIDEFTYGLITLNESDITKNSILSTKYYKSGQLNPYVLNDTSMSARGEVSLRDYYLYWLLNKEIYKDDPKKVISKFNLSFMIEDKQRADETFIQSMRVTKNNIYNNGQILIWSLY